MTSEQLSSESIDVASPEQIRLLFGIRDAHLKIIEQVIPVRITSRDGKIQVTGDAEAVTKAVQLCEDLLKKVRRGRILLESEVQDAVEKIYHFKDREADEDLDVEDLEPALPKYKGKLVSPRSKGQAKYLRAIDDKDLVFCSGPAGSGKTYLAVAQAIECLKSEAVRKIVLVRPAVEAGEKLGFLPGDMLAKVNPFLRPLLDALRDLLDYETVQRYLEHDVIEIVPLAFMRGRTLNETFMILDEAQNTTVTQMKMFLTRMGNGSKVVVTGDETQNDLPSHVTSGLNDAMKRLKGIPGTACVALDGRDIVRHRLVKEIVKAYDDRKSQH